MNTTTLTVTALLEEADRILGEDQDAPVPYRPAV